MTTPRGRSKRRSRNKNADRALKKRAPKKTPLRPADARRYWKRGRSGIHSNGLFAACDIERGTRVIEYIGKRLTKAQGWKRANEWLEKADGTGKGVVFVFELNATHDIDGNVPWNTARLINHSCSPNCEPRIVRGHIWIAARRRIVAGEELTYDYGYEFDHWEDHPCRCGSANCIGYILGNEHRARLRRVLAARKAGKERPRGKRAAR